MYFKLITLPPPHSPLPPTQAQIMARREEEFKGLQQEREAKQAARAAARKAEREMARRREFMRRCSLTVEARVAELEAEAAVVAEARRVEEEAERSRKVCAGGCVCEGGAEV